MEERFKYIHFKSEFFYNLLILNPSNYIKLIKIQITVNVSSKRRLGQDPTKYQGRLKKNERLYKTAHQPFRLPKILVRTGMSLLPKWMEILVKKEIMGIIHFLGRNTKIMCQYNIGNSIMTTLENKIFTLKQNHLMKKMKEIHFLNNLISDSENMFPYPLSNEILKFLTPEENDIAYVYFYGGINDSAKIPIELFPLFIIKIKNISNWLELINKPNFYCLKLFSHKIDKVIDISLLDNEEDVLSISIGLNA